ncbi:unnamed protein product [Cyprideis torosa]|uniref:histidinol dehydrogenase n=1 Tax=Cyprideis torosa TaxID=163714 RepID=A0A7R8WPK4_9CRUS|nr:unnamed protein product [Cyprideis torosa]CAG0905123.1 unnamed protein product [Cyprideis torosa]
MKKFTHQDISETLLALERPANDSLALLDMIAAVFNDIRQAGDQAVLAYTEKFDGLSLKPKEQLVPAEEFAEAEAGLNDKLKKAIQQAAKNIETFHAAQRPRPMEMETMPGVLCKRKAHAIEKVGLYIPGGTAPLFSTVLMLAIPAKIAGCAEIVLCTPAGKDGKVHPAVLYAAHYCGVDRVYKIGGSQAIAAMALGTDTVPKVSKIFGPGNAYVTAAKQYASLLGTAIDMPAGPSEVMVIADEKAKAEHVAIDLLSQAEHGPDSQVVLLSSSQSLIDQTEKAIEKLLKQLGRQEMTAKSLGNSSLVKVQNDAEAIEICNAYAPEHLILQLENTALYEEKVRNCGSVFIGYFTPESAGDYASGTNHTLPTNGYARQYSGVSLDSFLRHTTYQEISKEGLESLGETIITMAEAEGLDAHALAVKLRLGR